MFHSYLLILLLLSSFAIGQESKIEWSPNYQIQIDDFKPSRVDINQSITAISVSSGVMVDFAVQMSNIEFMFTKNFNAKLVCSFNKESASITAPDSLKAGKLLKLVQFDFDLSELYTRKMRKELFENKKMFSNVTFFQPYFDKMNAARNKISSEIYTASNFGENSTFLEKEHAAIKEEINLLSDFCKECKPPKKRK